MKDTSAGFEALYDARLMALSKEERLRMCCSMGDTARALVLAGLAPDDVAERRAAFIDRMYREDLDDETRRRVMEWARGTANENDPIWRTAPVRE